jgi:RimJ/RimL family protein N-acetyltransferase
MKQPVSFALVLNGECIGSVGFKPRSDVYIKNQELGYWLGEPFWGKGIMSKAVKCLSDRALKHFDIVRLEAHVYSWNPGSMRVVEKAGFHREAVLKQRIFKDGQIGDEHIFVRFK